MIQEKEIKGQTPKFLNLKTETSHFDIYLPPHLHISNTQTLHPRMPNEALKAVRPERILVECTTV